MNDINNFMKEKIIIITGANSGIGKETAVSLAKKRAKIVMLCRNEKRGREALEEIKNYSSSDNVELIIADLSNQESIYSAVNQFKSKYDHLDVLINNAGLILKERELTPDGYETTFAVNHLGHFLLTNLLLDILIKSAPSRIINVSSAAHKYAKLNLDDINLDKKYRAFRAYGNSKLANTLFTYELARRLEGTGVTVNALHPGGVKTNFGKGQFKGFMPFASLFMINAKKGAKTSIYLASSPEIEDVSGKYFVKSKPVKSSKISYNEDLQRKLWELSERMIKPKYLTKYNEIILKS